MKEGTTRPILAQLSGEETTWDSGATCFPLPAAFSYNIPSELTNIRQELRIDTQQANIYVFVFFSLSSWSC